MEKEEKLKVLRKKDQAAKLDRVSIDFFIAEVYKA